MSIIDTARQALTEIPISDVLRERLSLALDEAKVVERRVTDLQSQLAEVKIELRLAQANEQQYRGDYERLFREHEEEIAIFQDIEFRRGKRTLGKWRPFCPKCHLPLSISLSGNNSIFCGDSECNWGSMCGPEEIWHYENELPK